VTLLHRRRLAQCLSINLIRSVLTMFPKKSAQPPSLRVIQGYSFKSASGS